MDIIISNLLETSVYSCLAVIVVLILRIVFRKASRAAVSMLWLLVGIRLIIFVPIESRFAVIPELPYREVVFEQTDDRAVSEINDAVDKSPARYGTPAAGMNDRTVGESRKSLKTGMIPVHDNSSGLMTVLGIIWLSGASVMWLYGTVNTLRIRKRLSTAVKDSRNKDIFYTECAESAFVFGIIKPKIYVGYIVGEKDMECIIAHEREHIRRRDPLIRAIGYLLLSLYWFAPWVWVAYVLLCKDMELACDEGVIASMDSGQRAEYAGILYRFGSGRMISESGLLHFSTVSIKERIKKIMEFKKKSAGISCIIIAVVVLGIVLLVPVKDSNAADRTVSQADLGVGEAENLKDYLNTETGELIIPGDVSEISSDAILRLCKNRPEYIKVEDTNTVFDSRNDCNAIVETATGRLVFGCENTVIPDSVTEIAENAFANCSGLTEITIPDNVSVIGKDAFRECRRLRSVVLPKTMTEIGIGAFALCSELSSAELPESVNTIADFAFGYCGRLSEISLTEGLLEKLGEDAFIGCYSLPGDIKKLITDKCPRAYKLNLKGDDLSNVEYHFREEAPGISEYPEKRLYCVPDALDKSGNLSFRVVEYSAEEDMYIYTGETRRVGLADDCKIIVKGKTEKSGNKMRYINRDDLRYICDYYMVATDKNNIEEIVMQEYVFPFICVEENNEIILLRENID